MPPGWTPQPQSSPHFYHPAATARLRHKLKGPLTVKPPVTRVTPRRGYSHLPWGQAGAFTEQGAIDYGARSATEP